MNKSITHTFKKNILILTLIITFVFIVINISLYIINNNYLVNKVEEENTAFLLITTHIINENDVEVALEYIEHYTHIHKVNIEVLDKNQEMLFSSNVAHLYTSQYQIQTTKGNFTIFIDNTDSLTVKAIESNTIYVNVLLLVVYFIAMIVLTRINKKNSTQIDQDITNVLNLIKDKKMDDIQFNHHEFKHIHQVINSYLEDIDLLTEQKEMNMKGLAHDIKTPLTLIYSYFDRINKKVTVSDEDATSTFNAAVRVNDLLNDIIDDTKRQSNKEVNVSNILIEKQREYTPIFKNKNITLVLDIEPDITFMWSDKDFIRVIDNLISNAYYYSENDSIFKITARKEKKVFIELISKPIDIKSVNPNSMFKKGYRGASSDTSNTYGKGYGLYLCRLLLKTINGTIESEIINENVKFTIIL